MKNLILFFHVIIINVRKYYFIVFFLLAVVGVLFLFNKENPKKQNAGQILNNDILETNRESNLDEWQKRLIVNQLSGETTSSSSLKQEEKINILKNLSK